MFTKILVCVDPFTPNRKLLSCTAFLQQLGAAHVVLAHVIVADTPGLDEMLIAQARPEMERQKKILEAAGLAVAIEMPVGYPPQALSDLAEKHDVSVIVIGTHGRGLIESMTLAASPLGNVSAKLLQKSRRPVLLVRTAVPAKDEGTEECHLFTHVLFPTDFSDTAEVALLYLEALVRTIHCPLTLLHVQEERPRSTLHPSRRAPEVERVNAARLHRLKLWLENAGAPEVAMELIQGRTAGDQIVTMAKAKGCSLILMGTQGKGITREILLGSVAHQVARQADQPVLFVPMLP